MQDDEPYEGKWRILVLPLSSISDDRFLSNTKRVHLCSKSGRGYRSSPAGICRLMWMDAQKISLATQAVVSSESNKSHNRSGRYGNVETKPRVEYQPAPTSQGLSDGMLVKGLQRGFEEFQVGSHAINRTGCSDIASDAPWPIFRFA